MKTRQAFRPALSELLEARTVPSGFGLGGFFGFGGASSSIPAKDARVVAQAFTTFERSYQKDVNTILFASGVTNPSTDPTVRQRFDAQVAADLNTLNTSIDAAIANLPDAAALDATIQGELLASTSTSATTSLQTELAGIATPTSATGRAYRSFLGQGFSFTGQTEFQVVQQVRTANPPAGTVSSSTVRTLVNSINSAYQTFRQSYSSAITTTPPSTNRTAFDSAVAGLLTTLNGSVTTAVAQAGLPASLTASLTTTLTNDILTGASTTGSNSLQARLAAIKTPTSTTGFSAFLFKIVSNANVYASQARVDGDVVSAVNTYNNAL